MSPVRALARSNAVAPSDSELMDAIVAGSIDAFDELHDRYSARAFGVPRSICRDYGTAEDAVQEAFVSIFKTRGSYRSQRGTVAAWLIIVVRSRAIDVSRIQAKHSSRRAADDALSFVAGPATTGGTPLRQRRADRSVGMQKPQQQSQRRHRQLR